MRISRRRWMAGLAAGPAAMGGITSARSHAAPGTIETLPNSIALDAMLHEAVREDQVPGAVLVVGHQGAILHRKAYGFRALAPRREAMTIDTIFDAASLTKVIATTPAVMRLFERGELRLNDRVIQYLPEFQAGKSDITVRDLLTHFSGLPPDLDLEPAWSGYDTGIRMALEAKPIAPPGTNFLYSDIDFILLGEIVRRLAGTSLPDFVRAEVFAPLGMRDSMFRPPERLRARIAPTERVNGEILRGVVHDRTARNMGGVAGHAGLFTTAADLSRFAGMMLGGGKSGGLRVFSALTVTKFSTPQSPPDQPVLRGLGWDIDSPLSGNRGELFPIGSYGHTGFTGTSVWIDPVSSTYVILLANSVHPHIRPAITSLRGRVATAVAASLGIAAPGIAITGYNETFSGAGLRRVVARNASVLTGLDVLAEQKFAPLAGKRAGLITNHTGIDRDGRRNLDRMLEAGVKVSAVFAPEHGFAGREDRENIGDTVDSATGVPVLSLYNSKSRRPTAEMLANIDVLVFDIQDAGARFYTYTTSMAYSMEAAASRGIPYFVLDRPNPITGTHVEGPVLDPELVSFASYYPLALRHGMTLGEMARFFNARKHLGADLHVIALRNWQRGDWFDSTGLLWTDPSPNMRSLNAAMLYPGVAMLEGSKNYSVGRGTDAPFEQIGAEWIHGGELAGYLDARFIPGIRTYATRFTPASSNYAGRLIEGVRFVITDREAFNSGRLGLEIASALRQLYASSLALQENRWLVGNRRVVAQLEAGEDPGLIREAGEDELEAFLKAREPYLLYR
jgi:uncharacterized protein YbbC (DUF1343 family)/CubicO group peptidase (beta-lactamase class C family)